MADIIVTTRKELEEIIENIMTKLLSQQNYFKETNEIKVDNFPIPYDQCSIDQAIQYLSECGFIISKSKLYKLTSKKELDFTYFGKRLMFSRKALLVWANSQIINKINSSEATLTLAKNARKKSNK